MDPARMVRPEPGHSNCYKFVIADDSVAYRYDVDIIEVRRNGKKVNLTRAASDEKRRYDYLNEVTAYHILTAAFTRTNSFGCPGGVQMVYDNRFILFTNTQLQVLDITLPHKELGDASAYSDCESIQFSLTQNGFLRLSNFHNERVEITNFLEMLTSQSLLDSASCVRSRTSFYDISSPYTSFNTRGVVLYAGIRKGAALMKPGDMTLTIEPIVSAFFAPETVLSAMNSFMRNQGQSFDRTAFLKLYKKRRFFPVYRPTRNFPIDGLSDTAAMEITFTDDNGRETSLRDYYWKKYKIQLKHLHLPAVRVDISKQKGSLYFPVECLQIMPGQRVHVDMLDDVQPGFQNQINRVNSMKPIDRKRLTDEFFERVCNKELFNGFKVYMDLNSNDTTLEKRNLPTIRSVRAPLRVPFRVDQVSKPMEPIRKWAIISGYKCSNRIATDFVQILMREAGQRRVSILQEPAFFEFDSRSDDLESWTMLFEQVKSLQPTIVFLLDTKNTKSSHDLLKFYERKMGVLTQHINIETLAKPSSIVNIFLKFHTKVGGVNYTPAPEPVSANFAYDTENAMYFGYDVSHPKPSSQVDDMYAKSCGLSSLNPSVVGISFNSHKHPGQFVGNFFFQESRKEQVCPVLLERAVFNALEKRAKNRNAPLPKFVFVLRDGVSEGQYDMVIDTELPAFEKAFDRFAAGYRPKFVVIIATKLHLKRFYTIDGNNPPISCVIWDGVCRENVDEFFMVSATPIKGTAKPPNYVLLRNDPKLNGDELQSVIQMLCYSWQICASPVSLPAPVFHAHELAKRGANNLSAYSYNNSGGFPRDAAGLINCDALNDKLGYQEEALGDERFNA